MSFGDPLALIGSMGALSLAILAILSLFSVISWAIIFHKWRRFRWINEDEQQFLQAYTQHPAELDGLRMVAQERVGSASAAVFLAVLDRLPSGQDPLREGMHNGNSPHSHLPDRQYLEKVAQHVLQTHITQQEAFLPMLATTGNTTPFIGLLGTVLGIINAFREIGVQGSASIAAVAPGVAEALVATAAGLFAAIPAVMAYNYFLSRIRKNAFRVEAFAIEFLNALAMHHKALTEPAVETETVS
ncbi:MAG: protein TolQ [Nitrospirae bacterium]|nr:MAG: protein TolQ [Nitrospirota bacterium]